MDDEASTDESIVNRLGEMGIDPESLKDIVGELTEEDLKHLEKLTRSSNTGITQEILNFPSGKVLNNMAPK